MAKAELGDLGQVPLELLFGLAVSVSNYLAVRFDRSVNRETILPGSVVEPVGARQEVAPTRVGIQGSDSLLAPGNEDATEGPDMDVASVAQFNLKVDWQVLVEAAVGRKASDLELPFGVRDLSVEQDQHSGRAVNGICFNRKGLSFVSSGEKHGIVLAKGGSLGYSNSHLNGLPFAWRSVKHAGSKLNPIEVVIPWSPLGEQRTTLFAVGAKLH